MKKFLLSTAAVAMMFASATKAETADLNIYIDFESSVDFEQLQPLYFGTVDLAGIQDGDVITVAQNGDSSKNTVNASVGIMALRDKAAMAPKSLTGLQVNNSKVLAPSTKSLNKLTTPIELRQNGILCGTVDALGANWSATDGDTEAKITVGGEFEYKGQGKINRGRCTGIATLTTVY